GGGVLRAVRGLRRRRPPGRHADQLVRGLRQGRHAAERGARGRRRRVRARGRRRRGGGRRRAARRARRPTAARHPVPVPRRHRSLTGVSRVHVAREDHGRGPGGGGVSTPVGPSKGVAFTNWLVNKTAGLLEKKSSRRGFLLGSAMVGSAVAVAGCAPGTQPGSPYNHITDCAGGLCTDGYTEFCCTINNGVNACPPGSFAGGWW